MIPNLPTDNLYKFIALSGVFLVCFSLYFFESRFTQLMERAYQESLFITELDVKVKWLREDIKKYEELTNNSILDRQGKLPKIKDKLLITINEEEYKKLTETIEQKQYEVELSGAKITTSNNYSQKLMWILWLISIVCVGLISIGINMARYGFREWYLKVQVPLDESLNQKKVTDETS